MNNLNYDIGFEIKTLRQKRGLSQQALADFSGVSLPFINSIENGRRNISIQTLYKILNALEVSLSDFFLPYSSNENTMNRMKYLQNALNQSRKKEEYVELFIKILTLSNK